MKLTLFLIVLNVAVFVLSLANPNPDYFFSNFGFSIDNFLSGRYYTAITSMFLHGGLVHLGFNMVALLLLGTAIEKKAAAWQYLLVYFASGVVGALSILIPIFGYSTSTIGVGASGAISGLVGLGIFLCPGKLVMFPTLLPIPFAIAGAVYFLATLSGLFTPSDVAYSAHLLGFLGGAIFGLVWAKNRIKRLLVFIILLLLIIFLPTILEVAIALAL